MEIPTHLERSVTKAVAMHLETELGDRGLLLTAGALIVAQDEAFHEGASLRTRLIHQCYPMARRGSGVVKFGTEDTAARLDAALAFGAVTARLLTTRHVDFVAQVHYLCAVFNLGVGLVDSLCDKNAEAGVALVDLVQESGLGRAALGPRARGWLRSTVPRGFVDDPTVAFTVDVIEGFFETLHGVYAADEWSHLRRRLGSQLGAALKAERQSVIRSPDWTGRQELIESSRLTSVLPFQIIETLAAADGGSPPTAGTLLGEAMWRIDDLVDLCLDVRGGSLNGVLLAVAPGAGRPSPEDLLVTLQHLADSTEIAAKAAEAGDKLLAGLRLAGDGQPGTAAFLSFIQRYAGIAPPRRS